MTDFTPHEAPARDAAALPVMYPGRIIGRDAVLATIYTHLRGKKAVYLHGPAGVGKTALAATLASAYAQQPGGVLWLNVDDAPLEELIVRVGRAYKVPEITNSNNPLGMVGAVANTLTQHKPFVVLDGHLSLGVAQEFVTRCLSGLPALIIGEDDPGPSAAWANVVLEPLSTQDAIEVFKQQANIAVDDPQLAPLVEKLGRLPLALVIGARTLLASKQTAEQFLGILNNLSLPTGDPALLALTVSFRGLDTRLQGLVLVMGAVFAQGASAELLSMVSGAPADVIQQVMNMLAGLHMIQRVTRYRQPYYYMHPTVHAFAQSWLRGSSRLEPLQEKMCDSLLEYARKYSADDPAAHDRLAAEIDSFIAVAQWAADQGQHTIANDLVIALTQAGDFVNTRGYVYELLKLNRLSSSRTTAFPAYAPPAAITTDTFNAMLDEVEAEDDLDYDEDELEEDEESAPARPAFAAQGAGVTPFSQPRFGGPGFEDIPEADADDEYDDDDDFEDEEDFDDDFEDQDDEDSNPLAPEAEEDLALTPPPPPDEFAALRAQISQARADGDRVRQAELLKTLGEAQLEKDRHNEALSSYGEALSVYEALDDQRAMLEMLDTLATLMARTENAQAAVLHASRGIKIAEDLGEIETQMHLLITLGDARQELGESTAAVRAYNHALELARTADDAQNEAIILHKLGFAELDDGDAEQAINTWEQALALFKKQGKRNYEGRVLGGLGTAYGELQRWSEAINFHTSALYIAREVGDKEEEALQLSNLAYAALQANQPGQALLRYRQALHLAYEADKRDNIVSTIVDLVRLLTQSHRHLGIAQLLIEDAARREPHDRDVLKLQERITNERKLADSQGVEQARVSGTAQDYAANAYRLLDE